MEMNLLAYLALGNEPVGILCTFDQLRQGSNPVSVEEAIEELENFEKGIKHEILNHFLLYFINFSIVTNTFFLLQTYQQLVLGLL